MLFSLRHTVVLEIDLSWALLKTKLSFFGKEHFSIKTSIPEYVSG